ncbi:MAG: alpha/beta hydrolase [Deltaproteobacteria bacterium]|nr:alpha/beta hydrolase [Deltaproteobacteria bacterium]
MAMDILSQRRMLLSEKEQGVDERYASLSDGVVLKIIDFKPPIAAPEHPVIVFVAGWISLIDGWREVLAELTPRFRILYIETREKKSARLPSGPVYFSIDRLCMDIHEIIETEISAGKPFCFVGSSLGSTVILDYLSKGLHQPLLSINIAPNGSFPFPPWGRLLVRMFLPATYNCVKPLVKLYLRYFRLDRKLEPAQVRKYEGTLDEAEPVRLKASALSLMNYRLWDKLPQVKAPVVVIGARSDKIHDLREMERMVELMPRARLVVMESNRETHSHRTGRFIAGEIAAC